MSRKIWPRPFPIQGQFGGFDQVNLEITNLPASPLQSGATSATYTLILNVDGFASNAVEFAVK